MHAPLTPRLLLRRGVVAIWLAFAADASAQSLKVAGLTHSGNQITITVQNTGNSTQYRLDGSPSMEAGTWLPVVGATFTAAPGPPGFWRTTITRPGADRHFYRVVGFAPVTSPDDSDGDGLTNAFEATLATTASLWDTDGDGFSDGEEFTYGTDPLSAASRPVLATKPAVEFAELVSTGTEGSPFSVEITLDRPSAEPLTVKYAVVPANSTATAPGDFAALGGTVVMTGTTATIPITWNDDLTLKPSRALALDIIALSTDGYRTGGRSRHIILLAENDAWWNGVCTDTYAQRNFRVRMARNAAGLQVTFGSGPGNDGLPLLGGETVVNLSSQSEGIVPVGSFAGTVQSDTAAHFKITSAAMPVASSGITGALTDLTRTIVLEALPAVGSFHSIAPTRLVGTYTESLASATSPHLDRTFTGSFAMARDLPAPLAFP